MRKVFSAIKKNQTLLFSIAAVALFVLICIPLLIIAKYNYMSSDDFLYGIAAHRAIQAGQPWKIFGLAAEQVAHRYQTWQGSFSAVFLFALHPGIWGEKYYRLGIYIIILSLVITNFILVKRIIGRGQARISLHSLIGFCALVCSIQVFYVPYPEECFYWFNGSLYYTFFYALQLLFFSEILVFFKFPTKLKGKQWLFFGWMLLFAVILGGGNLATGLSTALALCLLAILLFARKHRHRFYILSVTAVYLAAFMVNMAAPGNAVRAQDPGYHTSSIISTVLLTIWHCITNIYSWTNYKMWLVLLIAAPILWQIAGAVIKNWKFTFRFPAIATIFLFGIYASQLAPITYMDGTFGPKRMGDMMWHSYVLWWLCLGGYWLGWLRYRFADRRAVKTIRTFFANYSGFIQLGCLALWCVLVLLTNVRDSSTYKAWAAWRSGEAESYAAEQEERLAVLHDPAVADVYFYPIEHRTEPLFFTDIEPDSPNAEMAEFYNKNAIYLIDE